MPGALPSYRLQPLARGASHFARVDAADEETPGYNLASAYQRESVWSVEQQVNLVRSLQMGLPVGSILTSFRGWTEPNGIYNVVDGRQRVETLRLWASGALAVPAKWFDTDCIEDGGVAADGTITAQSLTARGRRTWESWPIGELQAEGLTVEDEAGLYLLVNFGGVAQTSVDYDRAAAIANR